MPRSKNLTPSYLLHKPSGQARVRIPAGGRYREIYLGEYGSAESLEKYHRVLAEYSGSNGRLPVDNARRGVSGSDYGPILSIAALTVRYVEYTDDCCGVENITTSGFNILPNFKRLAEHWMPIPTLVP